MAKCCHVHTHMSHVHIHIAHVHTKQGILCQICMQLKMLKSRAASRALAFLLPPALGDMEMVHENLEQEFSN